MPPDRLLPAFFGHHKCATMWIAGVIEIACLDMGKRFGVFYDEKGFAGDLPGALAREPVDFLIYANADYRYVSELSAFRGFHIIRDPRDLLVSAYFSHLKTHATHAWPELIPHREKLRSLSKDEGMHLEMEFSEPFLRHMQGWNYAQPSVLEFKQEEFTRRPYASFVEAFDFIGLLDGTHYNKRRWIPYLICSASNILNLKLKGLWPRMPMDTIPGERLLGMVFNGRFEKRAGGRQAGEEDAGSHFRKGVAGDWVNHWNEEHVAHFKEKYRNLVSTLGYAPDESWTVDAAARERAGTSR